MHMEDAIQASGFRLRGTSVAIAPLPQVAAKIFLRLPLDCLVSRYLERRAHCGKVGAVYLGHDRPLPILPDGSEGEADEGKFVFGLSVGIGINKWRKIYTLARNVTVVQGHLILVGARAAPRNERHLFCQ
jgi:hypothetical protein